MKKVAVHEIDFRLLKVFKTVAECSGYAGAELELNINRSTISTHMSDLETRLGMTLCLRGRGRTTFALTPQGAEVYEAICGLFDDVRQFNNRLSSISSKLSGKLRIAIPDDWLQATGLDLAPVLARFRDKAPLVELEIVAHATNEIDFDLLNNRADVAINIDHGDHTGLVSHFLYSHRTGLYCGKAHPLFKRKDVSVDQLVTYDLAGGSYTVNEAMHSLSRQFTRRATANHMSGRALMILSGCYVGFLPDYYARPWVDNGQLKRLDVAGFEYDVANCVLYPKGARENPLVGLFVEETLAAL